MTYSDLYTQVGPFLLCPEDENSVDGWISSLIECKALLEPQCTCATSKLKELGIWHTSSRSNVAVVVDKLVFDSDSTAFVCLAFSFGHHVTVFVTRSYCNPALFKCFPTVQVCFIQDRFEIPANVSLNFGVHISYSEQQHVWLTHKFICTNEMCDIHSIIFKEKTASFFFSLSKQISKLRASYTYTKFTRNFEDRVMCSVCQTTDLTCFKLLLQSFSLYVRDNLPADSVWHLKSPKRGRPRARADANLSDSEQNEREDDEYRSDDDEDAEESDHIYESQYDSFGFFFQDREDGERIDETTVSSNIDVMEFVAAEKHTTDDIFELYTKMLDKRTVAAPKSDTENCNSQRFWREQSIMIFNYLKRAKVVVDRESEIGTHKYVRAVRIAIHPDKNCNSQESNNAWKSIQALIESTVKHQRRHSNKRQRS